MLIVESSAALVTAIGLWMLARRSVASWPVSLVGLVLYGWIFWQAKLYSDMLLQAVFAASAIYGWVKWSAKADDQGVVVIARPSLREMMLGALAGAVGSVVLGFVMARYTTAAAPWLDASLTSFSLVAQVWTARRFIQSWYLWIALDVIYVMLYLYKHLYPTSALYVVNIVLCVYGLIAWRRPAVTPRHEAARA